MSGLYDRFKTETDSADWSEDYDNPEDKAVLVSTDNVKYRVSHRLLCKHSKVFNSLLRPVEPDGDHIKPEDIAFEPITLDIPSRAVDCFIPLLSGMHRAYHISCLDFEIARDLLSFAERYKYRDMAYALRQNLKRRQYETGEPPILFLFASAREDWSLGRAALRLMDQKVVDKYFEIDEHADSCGPDGVSVMLARSYLNKLRPEWEHAILRLLFLAHVGSGDGQFSWDMCADRFFKPGSKRPRWKKDISSD